MGRGCLRQGFVQSLITIGHGHSRGTWKAVAARQGRLVALNIPGSLSDLGGWDDCLAWLKVMMSQGCHSPALRYVDAILHFGLVEVAGLTVRTRALDLDMLAWRKEKDGWMEGKADGWNVSNNARARVHRNDRKGRLVVRVDH